MDWLPSVLDVMFVAGQVSACLGLVYGGYLSLLYFGVASISDAKSASGITGRNGQPTLWIPHALSR